MDARLVSPVHVTILPNEDLGVRSARFAAGLEAANGKLRAVDHWYTTVKDQFAK